MEKIFPILLIIIDIIAGIVYLSNGDIPKGGYWLCAAGITFCTLFM